jgi:hypothetical protein
MFAQATTAADAVPYPTTILTSLAGIVDSVESIEPQEIRITSGGISSDVFGGILLGGSGCLEFVPAGDSIWSVGLSRPGDPLDDAEARALRLSDRRMQHEALSIIEQLRAELDGTQGPMPSIAASKADDGSFVIELIATSGRRRMGFTIEPEEGASGWFFVSSEGSQLLSASGSLGFLDPGALLRKLNGADSLEAL